MKFNLKLRKQRLLRKGDKVKLLKDFSPICKEGTIVEFIEFSSDLYWFIVKSGQGIGVPDRDSFEII